MTPRPADAGNFAEAVYAQMAPVAYDDANQGWALLVFLGALGQMFQQMDTLAHSPNGLDPWVSLLDIDLIPDEGLPWLGQFNGVSVDTSLTPAQQRQQIRAEAGMARGTVAAMVSAIQRYLIGSQTVILRERFTSAYNFDVITYAGDTQVSNFDYQGLFDQDATYLVAYNGFNTYSDIYALGVGTSLKIYNAILTNKPAGLQFTYSVLTGQDYWELWSDWAEYILVLQHYATYQAVMDDAPVPHPFTFETIISNLDYTEIYNGNQAYQDVFDNYLTY